MIDSDGYAVLVIVRSKTTIRANSGIRVNSADISQSQKNSILFVSVQLCMKTSIFTFPIDLILIFYFSI